MLFSPSHSYVFCVSTHVHSHSLTTSALKVVWQCNLLVVLSKTLSSRGWNTMPWSAAVLLSNQTWHARSGIKHCLSPFTPCIFSSHADSPVPLQACQQGNREITERALNLFTSRPPTTSRERPSGFCWCLVTSEPSSVDTWKSWW